MAGILDSLISALQAELQVQQRLAEVLDGKLDAMKHRDLSRLDALNKSEQQLVLELRQAGMKRDSAIRIASQNLFPNERNRLMTATEFINISTEPTKGHLKTLVEMLKQAAERVQRLNNINAMAMRKMLGHFDDIFKFIAQCGTDIGLYGRAGKKTVATEQRRLVDTIA